MKKMTTVLYMYLKVFLISKCRIGLHVNMIRFHYCNHEFCHLIFIIIVSTFLALTFDDGFCHGR